MDEVLQRYLRCTLQGQPSNTGVPDGDGRLSIIRNAKRIYTLKPSAGGELSFFLGASPDCLLWQGMGASITTQRYNRDAGSLSGIEIVPTTSPIGPFITKLTGYNSNADTQDQDPLWRVVSYKASVSYVGPPLTASGT